MFNDYYRKNKGSKKHAFSRWLFDKALFFLTPKPIEVTPNKILIICNGHIGDVVMATSIFEEIKKNYPQSKVTVITSKIAAPILEKNPYIDNLIVSDFFWRKETRNFKTFMENRKLVSLLKKENFDVGIAVRSDLPNIAFLLRPLAKKKVAYYNLDGGKCLLTNPILYPEKEMHTTISNIKLVNEALHMDSIDAFPEIFIDDYYDKLLEERYICIVPGACTKLQTWSKENYKTIISWMNNRHPDYNIVLAGGKGDEELINMLSLDNSKCIKMIDHNLRQLGIIFNNADCVIVQDGGPMHIAYTMMDDADQKLIILWGPGTLEHFAPLKGKIIHHKLDCYPCMRQESQCPKPEGQRCMDLITVEEVKQAIGEAIST